MRLLQSRSVAASFALLCALAIPPALRAQALYKFDLPAQALDESLKAVATRASTTVVFEPGAVADRRAPALQGSYSAQEAIERLLRGSGLRLERTAGGSLVVMLSSARTAISAPGGALAVSAPIDEAGSALRMAFDAIALEEIVVTGTLLSETAPTSPVIVVDRSEIERRGAITVQEVLRQTTQNFSGASPATTRVTGGNTGFTSQVDLRGLGSEATLTLVNGRRVTAAGGDLGRAVDLGFIPTVAIERVEILTDGASALYGSDAIGGVVNLILRQDFEGVETSAFYGLNEHGADSSSLSGAAGIGWGDGRAMIAAQSTRQSALKFAEIGITSADLSALGGADYRLAFAGQPPNVLPLGFFAGQPFASLSGPGGAPVFAAALPQGWDGDLADLRLNEMHRGDFLPAELTPETRSHSLYATLEHDFGPVELFGDVVYARRETQFPATPHVDVLLVMPTNPFSAFAEPVLVGYLDRDFIDDPGDATSEGWAAVSGMRGFIGSGWRWELAGSTSRDVSRLRPVIVDPLAMMERLASTDPVSAFNPFAPGAAQAPGVLAAVQRSAALESEARLRSFSGLLSGSMFQMPGGTVKLAVGAEHRREELDADVVSDASRDASAVFAELYLPLVGTANALPGVRELALSAAARFDSFSDFGDTLNPKLGLRWRPAERVLVKASYGTSFRAPLLSQLFFNRTAPRPIVVFDPNAPSGPGQVVREYVQGGNPGLKEETARTVSAGVSYEPAFLEGAQLGVNYFSIDYEDRIRGALEGIDIPTLLQFEDQLPPGTIERDAAGNLERLYLVNINSALTKMEGFDMHAAYAREAAALGTLSLELSATRYTKYEDRLFERSPVLDLAGRLGSLAKWRGRADFGWSRGPLGATLSVMRVDGLRNEEADPRIVERGIDGQTSVDLQLRFSSPARSGIARGFVARVGVKNLFDEASPFVDSPAHFGVDAQNYVIDGRTFYLSVSKVFEAADRP